MTHKGGRAPGAPRGSSLCQHARATSCLKMRMLVLVPGPHGPADHQDRPSKAFVTIPQARTPERSSPAVVASSFNRCARSRHVKPTNRAQSDAVSSPECCSGDLGCPAVRFAFWLTFVFSFIAASTAPSNRCAPPGRCSGSGGFDSVGFFAMPFKPFLLHFRSTGIRIVDEPLAAQQKFAAKVARCPVRNDCPYDLREGRISLSVLSFGALRRTQRPV